jgi:hypothetical protein
MIDEKTAMQWAEAVGINFATYVGITGKKNTVTEGSVVVEKIQALVHRAMNEAYERAAALADNGEDRLMGEWQAARIRALKQKPLK